MNYFNAESTKKKSAKSAEGLYLSQQPNQIYFIAIIPPQPVSDEITALRKEILPGFNLPVEHKKFPHITLQHTFRRNPAIASALSLELSLLADSLKPFQVTVEGFGHFDNRIIYMAVINNELLQNLYLQVRHMLLEKMNFSPSDISQSFLPHITLEKKLTAEQFSQGWQAVQNTKYKTDFIVHHFSLLKHNGIKWEPIAFFY